MTILNITWLNQFYFLYSILFCVDFLLLPWYLQKVSLLIKMLLLKLCLNITNLLCLRAMTCLKKYSLSEYTVLVRYSVLFCLVQSDRPPILVLLGRVLWLVIFIITSTTTSNISIKIFTVIWVVHGWDLRKWEKVGLSTRVNMEQVSRLCGSGHVVYWSTA